MKSMKRWTLLLLVWPTLALTQLKMELEAESGYTSNAFNNYTQAADYYTTLSVQANYDRMSDYSGWRGFYSGSLEAFKQYRERTYQLHGLGITHFRLWGEKGHRWQSGVTVQKRLHTEEYRWYEMQQWTAYTNVNYLLSDAFYFYTGANLQYRNFSLFKAFSYEQQNVFGRLSWFSAAGTSVSVEANLLVKNYLHSASTSGPEELPDLMAVGSGSSRQAVLGLRVAQSLSPTIGISLAVQQRINMNNSLRYLGNVDGYYYSDEELFDDFYGYHGVDISPTIKKLFNHGVSASLGATWQHKQYDNRQAAQFDGTLYDDGRLRDDKRLLWWVGVEKKWSLAAGVAPLVMSLRYTNIQNHSNDSFYHYNSGWFGVTVSHDF
jgi:hypothetical protein